MKRFWPIALPPLPLPMIPLQPMLLLLIIFVFIRYSLLPDTRVSKSLWLDIKSLACIVEFALKSVMLSRHRHPGLKFPNDMKMREKAQATSAIKTKLDVMIWNLPHPPSSLVTAFVYWHLETPSSAKITRNKIRYFEYYNCVKRQVPLWLLLFRKLMNDWSLM